MGIDARYLQDKNRNRFYPYAHADASFDRNGIKVGVRLDDIEMSISSAIITAKNYTDLKISDLIDGAPETLDTLKEIADVLADNEDVMDALDAAIGLKANASDLTAHIENNIAHITAVERLNWNLAKTHADSQHAPGNAEPNQNAYSNIKIGDSIIAADSKMDTLIFENGENIQFTIDEINNKINISASHTHTGLSSTGNSASTTKLATARKINGTSFDGTADIVTSKWGTSRTFQIGSVQKTIDGSADISFTMAELSLDKVNNTADVDKNVLSSKKVLDSGNNTAITFAYSKAELDTTQWFAAWNGYELRAISPSKVLTTIGAATSGHTHSTVTQSANGLMSAADKKKLDGISSGANAYSLPLASANTRGGVKTGYSANGKNYPVQLDSSEKMYVTVPWTDTNTNTWKANTKDQEGYVTKGSGQANKVWKTDANGNPAWRDDANTTYTSLKNPYSLTLQFNGTTNVTYDGSGAKTFNVTPSAIGAAASSHSHSYLPLSGGTMNAGKQIQRASNSVSWVAGRSGALLRQNSYTGYNPILSMKTTAGSWEMGVYTDNKIHFSYITDANFNAGNNAQTVDMILDAAGNLTVPKVTASGGFVGNASTASKLGSSTVGSSTRPIYLSAGAATALSYVAVAYGGTGSTTASSARTNLGAINFVSQTTEPTQNTGDIWFYEC